MWPVLVVLCLPLLGSGGPLLPNTAQAVGLPENDPGAGVQSPGTSLVPPVTPTELPTHSEAPALSLNLGLNFKIKVRSQGKGRPGEGLLGTSARPGVPPTRPAAPTRSQAPGARFWAEALGGSGWLGTSPADEVPSAPGGWAWDAPPVPVEPNLLSPAPTPQPLSPLWPKLMGKGLVLPAAGDSRELEFKIDIDLTAGLGKDGALAGNSSTGGSAGRRYPLLPGLSIGISEIAGKLGAPNLFGSTPPPDTWEPPEWNITGSPQEPMEDAHQTPAGALETVPSSKAAGQPWNVQAASESGRWTRKMDVASKPHQIPLAMSLYAEKYNVFQLMQNLMEALLVHRPKDPIDFLVKHLKKDSDEVPRICVVGPPASGKTTIARWLCKHLQAAYLCPQQILSSKILKRAQEAMAYQKRKEKIPDKLWTALLEERLSDVDCVKLGWVLDAFPETRDQALMLQSVGICPRHVIVLYAPDTVLIERNLGKLLDPVTQEVYHTTFDWPVDFTVQKRLVRPEGISVQATAKSLLESHRNLPGIVRTYQEFHKAINADQPCADVFAQALNFVQSRPHSDTPFTPRVLLLGPPGSGKRLQAALLAQKYALVNVFLGDLLRERVASSTVMGDLIKPCLESGFPVSDSIVARVIKDRLAQQDCRTYGWVLHGFPRDVDQAELLKQAGFEPNRVFFLHLPTEVAMQRICQRALDPVSGERYHTIFKPPAEEEVHRRLLRHPKDEPQQVEGKADYYSHQAEDLEDYYEKAVFINADQDPYTVFEYIESFLVKPLPVVKQ